MCRKTSLQSLEGMTYEGRKAVMPASGPSNGLVVGAANGTVRVPLLVYQSIGATRAARFASAALPLTLLATD